MRDQSELRLKASEGRLKCAISAGDEDNIVHAHAELRKTSVFLRQQGFWTDNGARLRHVIALLAEGDTLIGHRRMQSHMLLTGQELPNVDWRAAHQLSPK